MMPQTYMLTVGPDLERHDRALRGVVEADAHVRGPTRGPMLPRRSVASPLWRRLTVSSAAANASMPMRVGERPGVEPAQPGDVVDQVEDDGPGVVVVGGDEHVAVESPSRSRERRRRDVLERGDDPGARRRGLHRRGERAFGWGHRTELAAGLLRGRWP